MLGKRRGDTGRLIHHRQLLLALSLGHLDATLHVAHRLQILVELHLIPGPEVLLQRRHLVRHRIEDAPVLLAPGSPGLGSVLPLSPNIRSNTTRGLFSIGSGVVGLRHDSVFAYAQL